MEQQDTSGKQEMRAPAAIIIRAAGAGERMPYRLWTGCR
jgi:hypothetical protein